MLIVSQIEDARRLGMILAYDVLEDDERLPLGLQRHGYRVVSVGVPELTDHQRLIWLWMAQARGAMTVGVDLPILPPAARRHAGMRYDELRERARRYEEAFPRRPGIGSLRPVVVLVGETPNPNTLHATGGIPFSAGPAGGWLCEALSSSLNRDLAGGVYVTNAIKHDDDERTVAREIRWLEPRGVVALGNKAHLALTRFKIKHATVTHPQHARRFHYHESYAPQLRNAIDQALED